MSVSNRPPIRVGMIGIGNWAQHGPIRVLNLLPDYALSTLFSQRRKAAEVGAAKYGFDHVADSVGDLVRRPEVDLVAVLTTAPQHAAGIRTAIEAGKDVYCEWPLTTSTALSQELATLAEAKGVRTFTSLQRRFAPFNRYVKDLIGEGYIGRLRSVRMHVSMNYFQPQLPKALAWTAPPENFSSMVAIYAGHFLDMLFYAVGWPESIQALAVNQFSKVKIVETGEEIATTNADEFVLTGLLPNNAVVIVHLEGGKRNGSGVQIDISGTEGDLRVTNTSAFGDVGDDYRIFGARGDKLDLQPMPIPSKYDVLPKAGLPSAVMEAAENFAAFARDVRDGTSTAPTFRDAIRMHRLIDTALSSSDSGHRSAFDASLFG